MEMTVLLEIIVLTSIMVEIYSLVHHAKLERKVDAHMGLLDEHRRLLDEHITRLSKHLDSSHSWHTQNLESTRKEQET